MTETPKPDPSDRRAVRLLNIFAQGASVLTSINKQDAKSYDSVDRLVTEASDALRGMIEREELDLEEVDKVRKGVNKE